MTVPTPSACRYFFARAEADLHYVADHYGATDAQRKAMMRAFIAYPTAAARSYAALAASLRKDEYEQGS